VPRDDASRTGTSPARVGRRSRSEEIDMWIQRILRTVICAALAVLAGIGFAAEIVPTLGLAHYTTATYCASKEISQWASDY
jgi:hypothetical protein